MAGAGPPTDRDLHRVSQAGTAAVVRIVCEPSGGGARRHTAEICESERRRSGDRGGGAAALGRRATQRLRAEQQGIANAGNEPPGGFVAAEGPEGIASA